MHELGYPECSKSYVFRGGKEYSPKQIQDMLGLSAQNRAAPRPGQPMPQQSFGAARFLMPVQQCEFQLTGILEALTRDPWPVANDKRPLRCTGVALSVAVGLLEVSVPCVLITGVSFKLNHRRPSLIRVRESWCSPVGPPQRDPAWWSATNLRSPFDPIMTSTGTVPSTSNVLPRSVVCFYSRGGSLIFFQFYEALAKRVSNNGHVVDLFAGCLDQVGLLEMKSLPNSTNGVIVLSDSFTTSIFKQSFLRIFNKDDQGNLEMGFNATFDVQVRHTTLELMLFS